MSRIVPFLFVLVATTRPATAQTTQPAPAKAFPGAGVIQWIGLGGNSGHLRQMPPLLLAGGYPAIDRNQVRTAVQQGCTYVLFHCPGGTTGKTGEFAGMTWDQFPITEETPGMPANVSAAAFVKTFLPYRKRGVRFGIYYGNPLWSPEMVKLRDAGDWKAWWERFNRSLEPVLALEADLYIDAASEVVPQKSPLEYLALRYAEQKVKAYGGEMYVEEAYFCWNVPEWKDSPGFTAWPLRKDRKVPPGKRCVMFDQAEDVGNDPSVVQQMRDLGYLPACNVPVYAAALRKQRR